MENSTDVKIENVGEKIKNKEDFSFTFRNDIV